MAQLILPVCYWVLTEELLKLDDELEELFDDELLLELDVEFILLKLVELLLFTCC